MNRLAAVLVCLFWSAAYLNLNAQTFTEIANELEINHIFDDWNEIGGGAVFFDYDADGDEDLYFTGGTNIDKLYRNNGDATFTDVTMESGFSATEDFYTVGATAGDIDNDGYRDLYITTYGSSGIFFPNRRDLLFRNNGDGTFTEIGAIANISRAARSVSATFVDHDQDGFLDIYVVNYVESSRATTDENGQINGFDHTCYENFFYHNNGNLTFTPVATELGLADVGCGLAVTNLDYDMDGDPDLYTINDFGEFVVTNQIHINNDTSDVFDLETMTMNDINIGLYGMGIAWADYDLDQDFDYYISNLGANALLNNDGNQFFTDLAVSAGVDNTATENDKLATSWGNAFADINNDLYEDLMVANGYITAADFIETDEDDPNKAYLNNGDGTFTDVSDQVGFNSLAKCRGLTYADFDQDGDLDFFVSVQTVLQAENNMQFYRNDLDNSNNWVQIQLVGTHSNRDAIGSQIELYVTDGPRLLRQVSGGGSHASQNSTIAHFGLADYATIDSIIVRWPNGQQEQFPGVEINQRHTLTEAAISDQVKIEFALNMSFQNADESGVFVEITPENGQASRHLLYSPLQNGIYSTFVNRDPGFNGHYRFINGNCPDLACAEDLSEGDCGDPTMSFARILAPVQNDTIINACFGICPGQECQSTIDSFRVDFSVNAITLDEDLDEIYLAGISADGIPIEMDDPDGDGRFDISLTLPEGFSAYYTYTNGVCLDFSCAEDLSGQGCTEEENDFFRFLPPLTQDTSLNACFGVCNTDSCFAPIDTFLLEIELNMTGEDISPDGVFVVGELFSPNGVGMLLDDDGDGIYNTTFAIPEGQPILYTFRNGLDCPDGSCLEDLSGQECTDESINFYRSLPPITEDMMVSHCFGYCVSEGNCFDPNVFHQLRININMAAVDLNPTGVFIVGEYFGQQGTNPMFDNDGDGIYTNIFTLPDGFSTHYTFTNGSFCPGGDCFEDLSGQFCATPEENNYRFLPPLTSDTVLELCFNDCQLNSCLGVPDSINVTFNVNMAPVDNVSPDGVYWLNDFNPPGEYPMADPEEDGIYSITIRQAVGHSNYYTITNGLCPDLSCREDISGQECADPLELNYRLLQPVYTDTTVNLCFGSCETDNCVAPIDSFDIEINVSMAEIDTDPSGIYLVDDLFGVPGNYELTDPDGDDIYSITIRREEGFSSYYSFANGNCPDLSCDEDLSDQVCGPANAGNNRYIAPITQDTVINTCFAYCTADFNCPQEPEPVPVTFGFHDHLDTSSAIFLSGEFGLPDTDFPLVESSVPGEWDITLDLLPGTYTYRFGIGTPMNGILETFENGLADTCTVLIEGERFRSITVEDQALELEHVCFDDCNYCIAVNTTEEHQESKWDFKVQPNPAYEMTLISWETTSSPMVKVQVINAVGQVIQSIELSSWDQQYLLDTRQFASGFYLIQMESGEEKAVKKLIVR